MVLDTSAILAILFDEPESGVLLAAIDGATFRRVSAATLVETSIVVQSRFGDAGIRHLDHLLETISVEIHPVTAEQAQLARIAYRRFGKGRHEAGLNVGDCFAYALAMALEEPLLFKGGDFSRTDVRVQPY